MVVERVGVPPVVATLGRVIEFLGMTGIEGGIVWVKAIPGVEVRSL